MKPEKVVGIIPARYGSTRFPQKMLADVHGKPLIQYTYENALRCEALDDIVVATDHQEIFDHVVAFGGHVVMTSEHCVTGTDRLAEAVRENSRFSDAGIVVNIQGDEPKLSSETITQVVQLLKEDQEAQVSTACVRLSQKDEALDRSVVKCVKDCEGRALYFSRALIPHGKTGDFNPKTVYYKHLGIYAYRKSFLQKYSELPPTPLQLAEDLEQLKILENGFKIDVVEVLEDSVGIDTPEDLKKLLKEGL